jgi:chitodextrinase
VFDAISEVLRAELATLTARISAQAAEIAELTRRLAALESRKGFEYRGAWHAGEVYVKDDFVSHDGSMWHCRTSTRVSVPATAMRSRSR